MRRLQRVVLVACAVCLISAIPAASNSEVELGKTSARQTVEKYCRLDLKGARVGGTMRVPEIFRLGAWKDEPGWDTITVVRGYRLVESRNTKTGAAVRVEYRDIGEIAENTLSLKSVIENVTFTLRRSNSGWKIVRPAIQPHLSVDAAIASLRESLAATEDSKEKEKTKSTIKQLETLRETNN